MSKIDHERTHEIVCPHCGYVYSDSYEQFHNHSECADGLTCERCDKTFNASRYFSVHYTTSIPDNPKVVVIEFEKEGSNGN